MSLSETLMQKNTLATLPQRQVHEACLIIDLCFRFCACVFLVFVSCRTTIKWWTKMSKGCLAASRQGPARGGGASGRTCPG